MDLLVASPAPPIPATARAMIKVVILGATAHAALPMARVIISTVLE
jgi:hypothetical protein